MVTYSEKEKDSGISIQPTKVSPATIRSWIYWALWADTLWDCPGKVTERRWISSRVFSGVISQKQNKMRQGTKNYLLCKWFLFGNDIYYMRIIYFIILVTDLVFLIIC